MSNSFSGQDIEIFDWIHRDIEAELGASIHGELDAVMSGFAAGF